MNCAADFEDTEPADEHERTRGPAEQLLPDRGEAGDTGLVADSEASGGDGPPVHAQPSFAEQDAQKHPGDGPDARD